VYQLLRLFLKYLFHYAQDVSDIEAFERLAGRTYARLSALFYGAAHHVSPEAWLPFFDTIAASCQEAGLS
jgi:hypothetical protein